MCSTWKYIFPKSAHNLRGLKSDTSPLYGITIWEPSFPNLFINILPTLPEAPKTVTTFPLFDERPPVPFEPKIGAFVLL